MNTTFLLAGLILLSFTESRALTRLPILVEPEILPVQTNLPNPLKPFADGKQYTARDWRRDARPWLIRRFSHYMYGEAPPRPAKPDFHIDSVDPHCLGGKATRKEISIRLARGADAPVLHLMLLLPNDVKGRVPVFLGPNFCGNHTTLADPQVPLSGSWMPGFCKGCENGKALEASRGTAIEAWSAEMVIGRGYGLATFYNGDVEPDQAGAKEGIRAWYAKQAGEGKGPAYDWGAIAAWAWGMQRALDYVVTDPKVDAKRVIALGHSRNGKTALLAAAFDERFAAAIPIQAGCGGTAPSRGTVGESVKRINDVFPHWFNARFKKFNEQVARLPFDQHELIALVAPRPVLLPNATEDTWANPAGQFEMLVAADPVYRLLGSPGLASTNMPPTGQLLNSPLGYFIRPGKHSVTAVDWAAILDFTDRQLKRTKVK